MHWVLLGFAILAILPLLSFRSLRTFNIPNFSFIVFGVGVVALLPILFGEPLSINALITLLAYLSFGFMCVCLGSHLVHMLGAEKLLTTLSWFALGSGFLVIFLALINYLSGGLLGVQLLVGIGDMSAQSGLSHRFVYALTFATIALLYLYAKRKLTITFFFVLLVPLLSMHVFVGGANVWIYPLTITLLAIAMQVAAIKQRTGSTSIRSLVRVALLILPLYFVLGGLITPLANNELALPITQVVAVSNVLQFEGASILLLLLVGLGLWLKQFKAHQFDIEAWFFVVVFFTLLITSIVNFPMVFGICLGLVAFLLGAFQRKVQ
ncbi:MAG: hypothetical protein Q8J66_03360 [Methylotenera sp.]|nr:hypothetical protein [Methylotenera sp.]